MNSDSSVPISTRLDRPTWMLKTAFATFAAMGYAAGAFLHAAYPAPADTERTSYAAADGMAAGKVSPAGRTLIGPRPSGKWWADDLSYPRGCLLASGINNFCTF